MVEENKNTLILSIVVAVIAVVSAVYIYYSYYVSKSAETPPNPTPRVVDVKRQAEDLDALRGQANPKPLTDKEITEQAMELDKLRKSAVTSGGKVDIKKQAEELDKLREQSLQN